MNILSIRRAVSLLLLVTWILTGITGTLMLFSRVLAYLGYYLPTPVVALHVYAGFVALGVSALHIALNWNALVSYVKPRRPPAIARGIQSETRPRGSS